jgi:TRAP-type C4-dicarboxylate transport system substrate-binding protein
MNKAKFASLPPAHKAALAQVTGEPMAVHMGKTWDDADRVSAAELAKSNNAVTAFPAPLAGDLQKRLGDIELDWIKRAKEAGLTDPAAVLRELRAEIAKIKGGG